MAPYGGGRDYPPRDDRVVQDDEPVWTKFDLAIILLLVVLPIVGILFGV